MLKLRNLLLIVLTASLLASCEQPSGEASDQTEDLSTAAKAMAPSVNLALAAVVGQSCSFDNTDVISGNAVTAYQNSTVSAGQSCVSEQRFCEDGVLSGSYNYSSCQINAPASCLFNGQTVAHAETVIGYYTNNIELGGECVSENRTCNDGVLSGSYQYASCDIALPANCLFDGKTVANGETVNAYQNSSADFGSTCNIEQRNCTNGVLSGSYNFSSCQVNTPASCLFDGKTVAHGEIIKAFQNSSVSSGQSCVIEDRTCQNGVLTGSYNYSSCQVNEAASCLFDGKTVAHGDSINAYEKSTVAYGEMCIAESRTCDNGHLSGTNPYSSCDSGQPASCLFNGNTVPHGSAVTAFAKSSVNVGTSCQSEERICSNGSLSGSYLYSTCSAGCKRSCLFNGKNIANGESIVAFKSSIVKNNSAVCESEIRTCNDGTLSGSYTALSCKLKDCDKKDKNKYHHSNGYHHDDSKDYDDDFKDDDRLIKICKHVADIKKSERTCEKYNESLKANWYKYKEKYDCGLHLGWYKHKHNDNSCGKKKDWYKCRNKK